jgi:hypothetical protein
MASENYTRQRQGRDFSIINHLRSAEMSLEANFNQIDGLINNEITEQTEERKKKSLLGQMERFKADAERNLAPVDGHEPPERVR